jgi:Tfp pilus assembly protein PilE
MNDDSGLTVVEIVIVVAVLGVLTTVALLVLLGPLPR